MNEIMEFLPFLIPLLVVQLGLTITALIHVLRHDRYKFGNRMIWIIIVLFISIIGPILYFTIGRESE